MAKRRTMQRIPAPRARPKQVVQDGLTNVVTALGSAKDSRTATQYGLTLLTPDQLLVAYRSNWLARRIVDSIADDATREWRTWQASEQQTELLEQAEKDLGLQQKMKQALVRARLFGGSAIIMGIDGAGDASEPLDLESVAEGSLKFLLVLSSYEMSRGQMIADATDPYFGRPEYYQINTGRADLGDVTETDRRIHPSRVIEFVGAEIPSWDVTNGTSQWGDSVIQIVDDVIKDFGMSLASIAQMISDCKVDVFTIPNLTKKLANATYERTITKRIALSNQLKSTVNAMVMDENENWQRVQSSFTGLPQTMSELLNVVAGASGIPLTRLVGHGKGSSGLGGNAGGEADLRNYYDEVTAKQKTDYSVIMAPLDEVIERSALGTFDDSIYYEWTPLYTPDPSEEADIAVKKSTVFTNDVNAGLINPDVLRKARINQLIEDGFYPGIQDAIDEFGEEPDEPDVTPDDVAAHIGMLQKSSQQLQQIGQAAVPPERQLPAPRKKTTTKDGASLRRMKMFSKDWV